MITLCQAYRQQHRAPCVTAISAGAYGPGDDFSLENSHVIAGLVRRIHHARVSEAPVVEAPARVRHFARVHQTPGTNL